MISIGEPALDNEELENVTNAIKTNWISGRGEYISEFEEKFSRFCNASFGVATCNGTAAIHLALASIGIKSGDEVITPTFTTVASTNPILQCGGRPMFIDSDNSTWNIDPNKIEEKITKATKAIMVVHLYGHPCDMDPIMKIANDHNLLVIEDAAEAHGAEYKGKKVGTIGDIGCFSFFSNKIITTGEGGMIITNNKELAETAANLRDLAYGKGDKKFHHEKIGFNYRMTNLQAAIGVAQMDKIEKFIDIRRKNAKIYGSLLKDIEGITLPPEMPWAKNVYWMYTILIEKLFGLDRDNLIKLLKEMGIDTRPTFYPVHLQPIYQQLFGSQKLPVAEELSIKGINLPSGNTLTKEQIEFVCESIKQFKN